MPVPGPPPPLGRGFGGATATFVVVSSMVGAGVLTTSGYAAAAVGSHALTLGLWALGGLVALCGALTLAELSTTVPEAGGEYAILAAAYGPLAAFCSGWVSLLLGFSAPIGATAVAFARAVSATGSEERWWAVAAIVALAAVHAAGRGGASRVQGAVTAATVAALSVFVGLGLVAGRGRWAGLLDLPTPTWGVARASMFALVYMSYAYTGWNGAAYLAGEIHDPARRLPAAIGLGTAAVVLLYLGVNLVYALAIPAGELSAMSARDPVSVAPIAELSAACLFGSRARIPTAVASATILLGSLSALLLTGPRVAYAMAAAGQLPAGIAVLSGRGGVPARATLLVAGLSAAMALTGAFEALVVVSGVGLALFSMLTVGAVFVLRRRDLPRPFCVPLYPLTPLIYLVAAVGLMVGAFAERPWESALAVLAVGAGVPAYHLAGRPGSGRG